MDLLGILLDKDLPSQENHLEILDENLPYAVESLKELLLIVHDEDLHPAIKSAEDLLEKVKVLPHAVGP